MNEWEKKIMKTENTRVVKPVLSKTEISAIDKEARAIKKDIVSLVNTGENVGERAYNFRKDVLRNETVKHTIKKNHKQSVTAYFDALLGTATSKRGNEISVLQSIHDNASKYAKNVLQEEVKGNGKKATKKQKASSGIKSAITNIQTHSKSADTEARKALVNVAAEVVRKDAGLMELSDLQSLLTSITKAVELKANLEEKKSVQK